jgi:hypothetical protein
MRSFARSVVCVCPILLFACGDNLRPAGTVNDNDDTAVDTGESGQHGMPRAIVAGLDINSPSCDDATASFEVLVSHADDRTFVKNARCRVTFDDGAVSDLCLGEHTFASAGAHTFTAEVEDLDTGATVRVERTRSIAEPLKVDLAVDVPTCGLELAFHATLSTRAEVHVTMSPDDQVVAPHVVGTAGRFQVLAPGTYTITLLAEDERATGPICSREVTRTVTLSACPCDP